jgi:hypothetical protein
MKAKAKGKGKRNGTCYRDAFHSLEAIPYGVLCHGLVYSHAWSRFIRHAWIEIKLTTIEMFYDPATDKVLMMDTFKRIGKPKNVRRYSLREAREMALKTETYGPWKKEVAR